MPKQSTSIALEEDLILELERQIAIGRFRSRSHAIEFFITKALEQEKKGEKDANHQP